MKCVYDSSSWRKPEYDTQWRCGVFHLHTHREYKNKENCEEEEEEENNYRAVNIGNGENSLETIINLLTNCDEHSYEHEIQEEEKVKQKKGDNVSCGSFSFIYSTLLASTTIME